MSDKNDTPVTTTTEKVFAVFRNGHRVSNSEYSTAKEAQHEFDYWKGILSRWPDGSRLNIQELKWRRRDVETPIQQEKTQ